VDRLGESGLALWIAAVIATGVLSVACGPADPQGVEAAASTKSVAVRIRESALASARVWRQPATAIGLADLRVNPQRPDRLSDDDEIDCRFTLTPVDGTTPKFYCALSSGELVKIKYGRNNPELLAEVAASRLLTALGFMADHMFVLKRVRCAGCPTFPFQALRCLARIGVQSACMPGGIDDNRIVHLDTVVLERKLAGRIVEAYEDQGWGWFELDRIDAAHGGSTLAEVDAFRLMAIFLAHWDNKPPNQRLICPAGADRPDGSCAEPLAIIHDLGATFGPLKVDLQNWKRGQIWKDARTCTVSMEHMPWGGGTFTERRISDSGRLLFLRLVEQLSDGQLRDLFEGSRITTQDQFSAEATRADAWVRAFKGRVEQIRAAGPCPS
jgi:hypothetical protein